MMATVGFDNPFNVTKATDFTDQEIMDTWVDFPTDGGFFRLADPTSPMPLLLLGGKGSGRTHLMRYFSYPIQSLRHRDEGVAGVLQEGYLGVYLRCSGLNAGRFAGKGVQPDKWEAVFTYYMDLWMAQLTIGVYEALAGSDEGDAAWTTALVARACQLLDTTDFDPPASLKSFGGLLRSWQRELDHSINNAALNRTLDVRIRSTPGRLVFGIPQIAAELWPPLDGVQVLYLLDEFENLAEEQQQYVNTLLREKEAPCSFFIGSRLYGVRTLRTYGSQEENREGSEFESLRLDSLYFSERQQYHEFARRIIAQRLREYGYSADGRDELAARVPELFEEFERSPLGEAETAFVVNRPSAERPHFRRLEQQLSDASRRGLAPGISSDVDVASLLTRLHCYEYPLVEKVNCFLIYRAWSEGARLPESSQAIALDAAEYVRSQSGATLHAKVLRHFRSDLIAQMLRDSRQSQRYVGFEVLADMSGGLLRNLLIILKDVHRWASFNGEEPFVSGQPLSIRSQQEGVREAANWFFEDAQLVGELRDDVRDGVSRLGNMFRRMRFSDKPSESSLVAFSVDLSRLGPVARRTMQAAEAWSLVVSIEGGQRDRNRDQVDAKYQLNPMLAPRWDLPIYRRGAVSLDPDEVAAVFDGIIAEQKFDAVVAARLQRLNAPYRQTHRAQEQLPGVGDD